MAQIVKKDEATGSVYRLTDENEQLKIEQAPLNVDGSYDEEEFFEVEKDGDKAFDTQTVYTLARVFPEGYEPKLYEKFLGEYAD